MSEKNIIIEVNGLTIREDSLYKIVDKPDRNALDGLREFGSTKIPSEAVGNSVQCRYVNNLFDTGFYIQSPCYSSMDKSAREQKVRILQEKIVDPYETTHGYNVLDNKNDSFWEEFTYHLFEGRVFNTANVDDLLELYLAILGFELTPKDKIGDPRFNSAQFCVEDKEVTTKKKNEKALNYMGAMTSFALLITSEKNKLINCLRFVRMPGADSLNVDTADSTIQSLFHDWINSDIKNVDDFVRVTDIISKKAGLEEVVVYSHLLDLVSKGKITKFGDEFVYKEVPVGMDLKTAAKNFATKTSFKELKAELYKEIE